MKKHFIFLATLILCLTQAHARSNALEREMEDYARDLIRAHPEVAGEKKTRTAREDVFKEAKNAKLLDLTKAQEKKLRKREALVTDGVYKTAIKNMKLLNSKDPEIIFLLKYAEKQGIKPVEKTLAHRLLDNKYKKAAAKAAEARGKRMHAVMAKYAAYKQTNGKPPASLDDLELAEENKQFVDPATGDKHDWIYIGHLGARLKTNNTHVVLAEPIPLGANRVCGLDDGNIVQFTNSGIKGHLEKIQESMKNGTAKPAPNKPDPDTPTPPSEEKKKPAKPAHPALPQLKSIMAKYMTYKRANDGNHPKSLDDLKLSDDEKQYTPPEGGDKEDWIFLGDESEISVGNGVRVVICSPKASKGIRIVGLSDGRTGTIQDSNISKHLKKIKKKNPIFKIE
ncbi:MAG: hypothetical protein ACPG32_08710 [Akkermansiaceae bacterium]